MKVSTNNKYYCKNNYSFLLLKRAAERAREERGSASASKRTPRRSSHAKVGVREKYVGGDR
jgi:hypothetical protein